MHASGVDDNAGTGSQFLFPAWVTLIERHWINSRNAQERLVLGILH